MITVQWERYPRLTAAYRKADHFARDVRTIQVLIVRETVQHRSTPVR